MMPTETMSAPSPRALARPPLAPAPLRAAPYRLALSPRARRWFTIALTVASTVELALWILAARGGPR